MTSVMRAIEIINPGAEGRLELTELPVPEPAPGEILIKTACVGVNRADLFQKQGNYRAPAGDSPLPGLEVSGIVASLGEDVQGWQVGDELCALTNGGGYAEYCVVPAGQCLNLPNNISMKEAVALPEACFTVWMTLFMEAELHAGETLLLHGGASGIGTTAIQVANAFGAMVYTTAGTPEKCRICEKLGAAAAINYHEEDFVAYIKDITGGKGVDVVLDMVGGDYFQKNLSVLALDGRMVSIAFLRGSKAALNLAPLLMKRINWRGSALRSRSAEYKASIAAALKQHLWPKIASGAVRPVMTGSFRWKKQKKHMNICNRT